jgi:hypothetical protein
MAAQAGESLGLNRVTNVLLFASEEFALVIDCCHGRDAPIANGIHCSIQVRAVSEFEKRRHFLTRFDTRQIRLLTLDCLFATGTIFPVFHNAISVALASQPRFRDETPESS